MKIIIQEYGKAILASLAVFLLIAFCLHGLTGSGGEKGLFAILLKYASNSGNTYQLYEDRGLYHSVIQREAPVIAYIGKDLCAGERVEWKDVFSALDADNKQIAVNILCIDAQRISGASYVFPKSGIYEIQVYAKDSYGTSAWKSFLIPVQVKKRG